MTTFSRSPARLKGLAALVIGGLALSACATTPMGQRRRPRRLQRR